MRLKTKRGQIKSNVDMTPMIDIVFQLILFFLVSTTFAVLPAIKLKLPASHTSEGAAVKGITITAGENNSLYFNDKPVTMDTLGNGRHEKRRISSFARSGLAGDKRNNCKDF